MLPSPPSVAKNKSRGCADDDRDGLTTKDVLEDENTAFVCTKWEPLELWPDGKGKGRNRFRRIATFDCSRG